MEDKYLSRHIDKALLEWKNNPRKKPLLVRGARQVGKSSSVRHLGKTFKYFLEVNFERNPEVAEMIAGLELVKYASPQKRHLLYYWQNMNKGTCAEVDYVIAQGSEIVPVEVKSGVKGSMSSMYSLMRNKQKQISKGIRCSLENFGTFESPEGKEIDIIPIYALSKLF